MPYELAQIGAELENKRRRKIFTQQKTCFFLMLMYLLASFGLASAQTTWYPFPDFETEGQWIDGEYVYQMDIYKEVPSYLNAKNNGTGNDADSYYQCTEYLARYLHTIFGTNYTGSKDLNENTQGFEGNDFHPDYNNCPPKPTVDIEEKTIPLASVTVPQAGDIVVFTEPKHVAVVKSVSGTIVTLIEQNWVCKIDGTYKYTINRTIKTTDNGVYIYRYNKSSIPQSPRGLVVIGYP